MPAKVRTKYGGDYQTRRRLLLSRINASTQCWRCGRTLAQHPPHHDGTPASWHAGHLDETSGLIAAEASTCNLSAGASYGNRNRDEPHSERW